MQILVNFKSKMHYNNSKTTTKSHSNQTSI